VATNVLTVRLDKLVAAGVLEKHVYSDPGEPVTARCERNNGRPVSVSFVDESGSPIDPHHVRLGGPAPTNANQ
jgi:hypothetical protein